MDSIDVDPERMAYVEERYSKFMSLARKHHVLPEELYQHHQALLQQIAQLDCSDEKMSALASEVDVLYQTFVSAAD